MSPAPCELQTPWGGVEGIFRLHRGEGHDRQPGGESLWRSVVTQITRAARWVGLSNMCGTMLGNRKLSPASWGDEWSV